MVGAAPPSLYNTRCLEKSADVGDLRKGDVRYDHMFESEQRIGEPSVMLLQKSRQSCARTATYCYSYSIELHRTLPMLLNDNYMKNPPTCAVHKVT